MKKCPIIKFKRSEPPKNYYTEIRGALIEATVGGQSVGKVIVVKEGGGVPYVSFIRVEPEMQRCGLGTKLYEQAASYTCKAFKEPLHSDRERTAMSDGFWAKQVVKGRAACVSRMRNRPEVYESESYWSIFNPEDPAIGRSGCERYKLTCPAPKDLSRRKRKRR